jgi:hypothetical protein
MTWLYPFAFALVCWYAFAMCVNVYRQWVKGTLGLVNKLLFILPLIFFAALDVVGNYTVFMVFGHPPSGCYMITQRMGYYKNFSSGIRKQAGTLLCALMNQIDVTGEHC